MGDVDQTATRVHTALHDVLPAGDLLPLVYDQLRALARSRVRSDQTVHATDVVHESWLKVMANGDPGFAGRTWFFMAASRGIRNVLVDQARRRSSDKRDVRRRASLDDDLPMLECGLEPAQLLDLHAALERLAAEHARPSQVIELRFFTGLSMPEVAEVLDVSIPTVERDWRFARAWLRAELGEAWELSGR